MVIWLNINRMELTILLTKTEGFDVNELNRDDIDRIRITYPEYTSTKLKDCAVTNKILQMYSTDQRYQQVFVNLVSILVCVHVKNDASTLST